MENLEITNCSDKTRDGLGRVILSSGREKYLSGTGQEVVDPKNWETKILNSAAEAIEHFDESGSANFTIGNEDYIVTKHKLSDQTEILIDTERIIKKKEKKEGEDTEENKEKIYIYRKAK